MMYFIHCILTKMLRLLLRPCIYITYIILTEIIIIFSCYGVTATQLTAFVPVYFYNNITLKMAAVVAETCC
jgi:hypothetical protein